MRYSEKNTLGSSHDARSWWKILDGPVGDNTNVCDPSTAVGLRASGAKTIPRSG